MSQSSGSSPASAPSRILPILFALVFIGGAIACLFIGPVVSGGMLSGFVLTAIGVVWMTLSFRSAKGSQLAQVSSTR